MTVARKDLKEQVLALLDTLPAEALAEVATFLDYQRYKIVRDGINGTPYRPVALGGLWSGLHISDEDIADVRPEMWSRFADSALCASTSPTPTRSTGT